MKEQEQERVRELVREGYARIADSGDSADAGCCGPVGGCGVRSNSDELARSIGYDAAVIASLPEGANMGLSCGNPAAIAALQEGETVLDLGSGGGFDCFVIGPKIGARGRVIGIDMTPAMLAKARRNAGAYRERTGLDNVEFRLGEIEHLPVADASVDVVISNCVLNLSPDKQQVWHEIARVLKPGGRVAISDLALLRPLPAGAQASVEALVGCVGGAILVSAIEAQLRAAGLVELELVHKPEYVASLESFQDPLYAEIARYLPAGSRMADFVTSLDIRAKKPEAHAKCCA
jgi:arsenite methyltransferase